MNLQSILKSISLRPGMLKRVVLGGGAVAFGLYRLLYAIGIDGRGLLKSGHFAWVLLCILSIAMGAVIFASASQLRGGDTKFRRCLPAAVCCGLALVSAVFTGLSDLWTRDLHHPTSSSGYLPHPTADFPHLPIHETSETQITLKFPLSDNLINYLTS